ncbi:hypothetical protein N7519_002681 [Penicillium mononematosum]|uniref:uncharacterized protein n=1 Tax=Penicillium mononematosum TaxID=268346 RepID=UPI002548835C|nr:uncharacterized protein N7519_002681 [Penicillium mononematosum]KAJ6187773.1 hypothetical protein N7519_002681 [Penicillium mononematosum]
MDEALLSERAARRHTLARIENLIKKTPDQHVEPHDLKAAGIRHSLLSLKGDTQHCPHFFKPYQEELPLPEKEKEDKMLRYEPDPNHIMWETREMEIFLTHHFQKCWRYASKKYPNSPPASGAYREIGDYRFGQLLECIGFNWLSWKVKNADDRLLRGEIMTITDIMAARLKTKSLRQHIVAPMLVWSLMGPRHARVLEADFDGKFLNIRASKLYDFTRKNTDTVQLMTRYWLGDACGQTLMET